MDGVTASVTFTGSKKMVQELLKLLNSQDETSEVEETSEHVVSEMKKEVSKKKTPEPTWEDEDAEEVKELTADDVRRALKEHAVKNGAEKTKKILAKWKASTVKDLDPKNYEAVIQAAVK